MKKILIIGGTAGLGLSLAEQMLKDGNSVYIAGRTDPKIPGLCFIPCTISEDQNDLSMAVSEVLDVIKEVDVFVYAVGFNQIGLLDSFESSELALMVNVGLLAPVEFTRQLLAKQGNLPGFIAITSTSATIPRKDEPVYAGVKAGLAHFTRSVALDERVTQTLIAAPAGMNTRMQHERGHKSTQDLLDPKWVAEQILTEFAETKSCREILILREPPRIEVVSSV